MRKLNNKGFAPLAMIPIMIYSGTYRTMGQFRGQPKMQILMPMKLGTTKPVLRRQKLASLIREFLPVNIMDMAGRWFIRI